jgi:deazaflavin-dependent oxidoreductase (nitroreductase family)
MPMPRAFRSVARAMNPAVLPLAARVQPLAVIYHQGRRTGRKHRTPVMAFAADRGWIIALAYGADVQWRRNLDAAGSGALVRQGRSHRVSVAEVLGAAEALPLLPSWARVMIGAARVDEFLVLR